MPLPAPLGVECGLAQGARGWDGCARSGTGAEARTIRRIPRGGCFALLGLLLGVALPALSAAAEPVGAAAVLAAMPIREVEELREKKVVLDDSGDATHVTGLVIFARPADRVMRLLTQTARQKEFRPELRRDETVETTPDGTIDEQEMRILFTNIRYFLRYRVDYKARRISWQLDPKHENDLREVNGYWQLYDLGDGRTLARFGTQVDVGGLPAFLQAYATRKEVPKTLENARRWIDSDGRWRP